MAYGGFNPDEGRSRFAKLGMAINDELTQAYRDLLEMNVDPKSMNTLVKSSQIVGTLSKSQRLLLKKTAVSGYKELDISLMYKLLRNICLNIPEPTNGWGADSMPIEGENTVGDDIERIRLIRNDVFGHVSSASTSKVTFDTNWSIISKVCTRLGLYTGKNYLNGLENIKEQALRKEDEEAEIQKIQSECDKEKELKELIMSLKKELQELKKPTRKIGDSWKSKPRHVLQIIFKAKRSQRKLETITNNIKDGINFMIESIRKESTEEDICSIQENLKRFLDEVHENDIHVIKEMLTKMNRKMQWFSSLHPDKQVSIFQKFLEFLWDLSSKYDLETLDLKSGSILLDLTFATEDGYTRFLTDVKNKEVQSTLVKVFCDSDLLSAVSLQEEDISVSIAPFDQNEAAEKQSQNFPSDEITATDMSDIDWKKEQGEDKAITRVTEILEQGEKGSKLLEEFTNASEQPIKGKSQADKCSFRNSNVSTLPENMAARHPTMFDGSSDFLSDDLFGSENKDADPNLVVNLKTGLSAGMTKVTFNVIVPSNFIRSSNTVVQIRLEGKINRYEKEASRTQNDKDSYTVIFHVLFTEEETRNAVIYYYLSVTNEDYDNAVIDRRKSEVKKRTLTFEKISSGEWWQYDGVLKSGERAFLGKPFDSTESRLKASVKYFFPKWKYFHSHCTSKESASLIMKRVWMLYEGLLKNYYTLGKKWKNEKQFKEFIGKLFLNELKRTLVELIEFPQILHGVAIILLDERFNIPFEDNHRDGLLKCLVLDVQEEEKKSEKYNDLVNVFNDVLQDIPKALLCFIKSEKVIKNPSWLCSLPLLHFLKGKLKPFDDITEKADYWTRSWWGMEDFPYSRSSTLSIEADMLLDKLIPMFPIDFYLQRASVDFLEFSDIGVLQNRNINPEVLLAGLIPIIKKEVRGADKLSKDLLICVEKRLIGYSKDHTIPSRNTLTSCYLTMKIAEDLVSTVLQKASDLWKKLKGRAVKILFVALSVYEIIVDKTETFDTKEQYKIFYENTGEILKWLDGFIFHHNDMENLQIWDILFLKELPACNLKQTIEDLLKKELNIILGKLRQFRKRKVVQVYLGDPQKFSATMREMLDEFVIKILEMDINQFSNESQEEIYTFLLKHFEEEWKKRSSGKEYTNDQLKLMLTWKPFTYCFQIYCVKMKASKKESPLDAAAEALRMLFEEVHNAEIKVGTFNLLQNYEKEFCELVYLLFFPVDIKLSELLTLRKNEMEAFDGIKRRIGMFIDLCQHFEVDVSRLEQKLEEYSPEKTQEMKVRELCVSTGHRQQPLKVLAFDVPPTQEVVNLTDFEKACKGTVFMKKWIERGKAKVNSKQKQLELEEAIETFQEVVNECKKISESVISGDITFSDFEKLLYSFRNDEDILTKELEFLCGHDIRPLIKDRIEQIQQYNIIENCRLGADILLRIAKEFELKGSFQQIHKISSLVKSGKTKRMREMNNSLIVNCKLLETITEEKSKCLETFVKCQGLIRWIQKNIKGKAELDSFLQLAYAEAGEGEAERIKVSYLCDAIIGFQHLILNLQSESDCGDSGLLKLCEEIWKELKSDKSLPAKLRYANRHLDWYISVNEKQQRSVESTTLEQVKNINSNGVYHVGKITEIVGRNPTLEQVLEVGVICGQTHKKYKYGDLQDLQSKLMLVTGQDTMQSEAVLRFTTVFEAVVRLSKVFIRLLSAGCVLFDVWKSRFLCDREREVCAFLQFGKAEFKGKKSASEDVSTIIPNLCSFMEDCLDQWIQYVNEKRRKYHEINFFTIDQIVILQREIAKFNDNADSKDLIPLLSMIKHECSRKNIANALREVAFEIEQTEIKFQPKKNEQNLPEKPKPRAKEIKESLFLDSLQNAGFSESLARAALRSGVSVDDIEEGVAWCISIDDDALEVIESEETTNRPQREPEQWDPKRSLSTATLYLFPDDRCNEEIEINRLLQDIRKLWDNYLNSASFSVSDFYSLEHLGRLLKKLARMSEILINRKLHDNLQKGIPNLLLCPRADILKTVLSIYAFDQSQPFPQPDEILFCSDLTTLEEVEIFWRRAFSKDIGKIFCLVNADNLKYEVSDEAERNLERHLQLRKNDKVEYSLVVVCSMEAEESSRISAALDKYRRNFFSSLSKDKICMYIKTKLSTELPRKTRRPKSARRRAEIEIERCSTTVVQSTGSGNGKTLFIGRLENDLTSKNEISTKVSIPLFEKKINFDDVIENLQKILTPEEKISKIIHIDLTPEVIEGVDYLIFHLIILGYLKNSTGSVWKKLDKDFYIIETTQGHTNKNESLALLPSNICCSPTESLESYDGPLQGAQCQLFDQIMFRSEVFQRPYQYLLPQKSEGERTSSTKDSPNHCIKTLLRHCGMKNASWATINNFVRFLNTQLDDYEKSVFLKPEFSLDLPGFSEFVLKFLIQMSRDFALPSTNMSEDRSYHIDQDEADIEHYTLRRTWENSHHDYLFFNPDHNTMTFFGFEVEGEKDENNGLQSEDQLGRKLMSNNLYRALLHNTVDLNENYDNLERGAKLLKLCRVMGLEVDVFDPDPTYELTKDNAKKILAIFMRFRSGIPVIVMGETGCGKTRLIKFMCSLQRPVGTDVPFQNLMMMKVDSGVKKSDIIQNVKRAAKLAEENFEKFGERVNTVLFFDETNTTELIGLIKEIMCDGTVLGEKISPMLKIVAACNPYRKHSKDYLEKLEHAGLGYHVPESKSADKMGRIAMRKLVYRVQPLPCSMLPLVWDFGHLEIHAEEVYIERMVETFVNREKLWTWKENVKPLSRILTAAQRFMKLRKDESSFVSLRNVQRTLMVMLWFCTKGKTHLLPMMKRIAPQTMNISDETAAVVLALGVCYHASLKDRETFRKDVSVEFKDGLKLKNGPDQMLQIIERCQDIFLENVTVRPNIAKNKALRENIFMMVICIELRIPLFVIGKPGSSKSLAKSVVSISMQGKTSQNPFFHHFKQVHMITFQCSPLSAPEGIIGTFKDARKYQETKDQDRHVAVVVLEEIGLAEDSPKLPLKTLHSLLENDCHGEEVKSAMVSFIGISNWALDPAKMNRGICVQIDNPDLNELVSSAEEICSPEEVRTLLRPLFKPLADSYLQLLKKMDKEREFFGLRDFYSLLKMISDFAEKRREKPTWTILRHCIKRNFGGTPKSLNPENIFSAKLSTISKTDLPKESDPDCTPLGLIMACLQSESDNRYLLLLTETSSVVDVLQQSLLSKMNPVFIFGSSFPKEQEDIQVSRNINRIKICMEAGATVVLLNLENLYESLYDALNQYYAYFGGNRYVDLGLGTQRVKCKVDKRFRLIVVAETKVVYSRFPIPLINRLEKHFLQISTMLSESQHRVAQELQQWVERFVRCSIPRFGLQHCERDDEVRDAFIGFNADSCAAATLQAYSQTRCAKLMHSATSYSSDMESNEAFESEVLKYAQKLLLYSATPDGVLRSISSFSSEQYREIEKIYFREQNHEDFVSFVKTCKSMKDATYLQITTHSKCFTSCDFNPLCDELGISKEDLLILNLLSFDTENNFRRKVRSKLECNPGKKKILIVQCDNGTENGHLITCARFTLVDQVQQIEQNKRECFFIILIIHIPRLTGKFFAGFQCEQWRSVHLDDIRRDESSITGEGSNTFGMLISFTEEICLSQTILKSDNRERQESYNIEKRLNLPYLIEYSAHKALSRVEDSDTNRSKERIEEILPLLENNGFVHGIGNLLVMHLKKREEEYGQELEKWLYADATDKNFINRAGTFRKALDNCIRDKLSPILAEIISTIDTNKNIRILIENPDPQSWKNKLWLGIVKDPEANLTIYSSFTSSRLQDLGKAIVVGTGVNGKNFDAEMPFSWIIYKNIADILQPSKLTESAETPIAEIVQRESVLFEKTLIGKKLLTLLKDVDEQEYVEAYSQDFISMVYPAQSPEEKEIVRTFIKEKIKGFPKSKSTVEAFLKIHAVYDKHSCNFRNFSRLIQVCPSCTSAIAENVKTVQKELDFQGLQMMLKDLEPGKNIYQLENRIKWQKKFHKFRGIIEDIIEQNISGDNAPEGLEMMRKWTKCVVIDLFLQHCGSEFIFDIDIVRTLWMAIKERDFKEVAGIEAIEKFLTGVFMRAIVKKLLGSEICKVCETEISEPPVHLECNSVICQKCFNEMKLFERQECPSCHKQIPKEDSHENQTIDLKYQELQQFTRKINSFFLDLIFQLCFTDGHVPSKKLVQKLMSYITLTNSGGRKSKTVTKQMTVFASGIDPSPVLRSYLLQCLLKTNVEDALEELQKFLTNSLHLLAKQDKKNIYTEEEFFAFVVNCFEDSLYQQLKHSGSKDEEEVAIAIRYLKYSRDKVWPITRDVKHLKCVAEIKFALCVSSKNLHDLCISKSEKRTKSAWLLEATKEFCTTSDSKQPLLYLIKILCRTFGYETYSKILKKGGAKMGWIDVPELHTTNQECCDRFIVCGEEYAEIRENILQSALNRSHISLYKELDCEKLPPYPKKVCVLLAVFKEITMNHLYPERRRRISSQSVELIWKCIGQHSHFNQENHYLRELAENRLFGGFMTIKEEMDIGHQSLVCLLLHKYIVMKHLPSQNPTLLPLFNLICSPRSMLDTYLPTMPQDDFEEVKEVLLAQRVNENPVFYHCPNGHRYIIGDCGRPIFARKCPECGADIGGKNYELLQGNQRDDRDDQTSKGHILGDAEKRTVEPIPERNLSSIECGFLRLLIHCSMYLGATFNPQEIGKIITPNLETRELLSFLWTHIEKDLAVLQKAMGKSRDDIYVLSHRIFKDIMEKADKNIPVHSRLTEDALKSKDGRQLWETEFSKTFLLPILKEADDYLKVINEKLVNDKRLGNDPLMCLQNEIPIHSIREFDNQGMSNIWRYRERITIPGLLLKLEAKGKKHKVLCMFLREEHFLRAVYQIPRIMQLQKILLRRFQMRLGRKEAKCMTIEALIKKTDGEEEQVSALVDSFLDAWNCVSEQIQIRSFPTENGLLKMTDLFCPKSITRQDRASFLFPTYEDDGFCSYALLYYLLKKHNDFIQEYNMLESDSKVPEVPLRQVSSADLIRCHPENDMLPLILSNFQYSYEVGKETSCECNFESLERQIKDRFLFSKPRIKFAFYEIEIMNFRSESTTATVFTELRKKIRQEPLEVSSVNIICNEIAEYSDLCDTLDKLDITIRFLKSMGSEPDMFLEQFMTQILRIQNGLPSQKAKSSCLCKHIQSLWISLAFEKTKREALNKKEVFDNLTVSKFKKELQSTQEKDLEKAFKELYIEDTHQFLFLLFECITLIISKPQDNEDDVDVSSWSVKDVLIGYVTTPQYDVDPTYPDWLTDFVSSFPETNDQKILTNQAISTWLFIFDIYVDKCKKRGMQRF